MTNAGGRNGDNDNNKSRVIHNERVVRLMYNYQAKEPMSCELCGDTFTVPVSYHMLKTHPGCGQSSHGRGYTSNGTYKSGWLGDCGEGGIAWYLLCESCRRGYMKNAKPPQAPVNGKCVDPPNIRRANDAAAKMAEQIVHDEYPYEDSDDSDDSSTAAKQGGVQFCGPGEQPKQLAG